MTWKWIAVTGLLLVTGWSMTACKGEGFPRADTLAGVTRIEVQSGDTGQFVSVNDAEVLQTLTGYFTAQPFAKDSPCPEETGWSYRLKCYDAERELQAVLDVMAANQVCSDGILYTAEADDAIDIAYLQGMLTGPPIEVSMSIQEGTLTPTGATLVLENPSEDAFIYGSMYRLEKKEDGAWRHAETLLENYMFHLLAYTLGGGQTVEENVDWEWLYGALQPGEYRIIKDVGLGDSPGGYDDYYLSAAFEID